MWKRWRDRTKPGLRFGDTMLLNRIQPGALAGMAAPDSYRPNWTAADRRMWDRADERVQRYWIARGETYRDFAWLPLEPMYSDYQKTGNRQGFESGYHKRRQVVTTLVLAEAFEHRGRFIEPLLDAIDHVCDEPTWVLPAHEQETIDLFSAETGNLLAWTCYIFGGEAAFAKSVRAARALHKVRTRLIEPYLKHDDYWWMALKGEQPGNWTTWCTSNCLGAVLLIETNAQRRAQAIEKACRSLHRFIEVYADDGGCDEGPMYWNFAAGCLFDCLEMLHEASEGALDLFHEPVIRNLAAYIGKVHIHDLYFVNFADSPPEVPVDAALLHRFGSRIGDLHLQALGAHLYRLLDRYDPEDTLRLKMYRMLATLAAGTPLRSLPGPDLAPRENYLPKLQVAVAREDRRAGHGLVLAAKGGHNSERHNHNDVGNVIVYLDGRPAIIDVGSKQYSKETFSERRYQIWAMQSAYHNVPFVNECMQKHDARAAARDAWFTPNEDVTSFGVDISDAYPEAAGLIRWLRTFTLVRSAGTVRIHDEFRFTRQNNRYEQRFMTACRPRTVNGGIALDVDPQRSLVLETIPGPTRVTLHEFDVKDNQLRTSWGGTIYQVRLHYDDVGPLGHCDILIATRRGDPPATVASAVALDTEELP